MGLRFSIQLGDMQRAAITGGDNRQMAGTGAHPVADCEVQILPRRDEMVATCGRHRAVAERDLGIRGGVEADDLSVGGKGGGRTGAGTVDRHLKSMIGAWAEGRDGIALTVDGEAGWHGLAVPWYLNVIAK